MDGPGKVEVESRDVGEHRRNLPENRHSWNSTGMVPRDGMKGFSSHPNFINMTQVTSNKHNLIKIAFMLPTPFLGYLRLGEEEQGKGFD